VLYDTNKRPIRTFSSGKVSRSVAYKNISAMNIFYFGICFKVTSSYNFHDKKFRSAVYGSVTDHQSSSYLHCPHVKSASRC
jgi:hypothetical protein